MLVQSRLYDYVYLIHYVVCQSFRKLLDYMGRPIPVNHPSLIMALHMPSNHLDSLSSPFPVLPAFKPFPSPDAARYLVRRQSSTIELVLVGVGSFFSCTRQHQTNIKSMPIYNLSDDKKLCKPSGYLSVIEDN